MSSSDVQRKLTAILCTDVVGYSRLMGDDAEGTLHTLTEYREVFSSKIEEYKGRVVNAPGDSLLADFTSVLDAVSCAVEIQRELAERNQEIPDDRRMDFRIGINLGDVLVKDGAIYGDGVNVAARLESLADPGGICISGKAYEEVKNRLPLHFDFKGDQVVKNIAEPVKTYRVLSQPGAAAHRVVRAKRAVEAFWKKTFAAVVAALLIAGAVFLGWNYYQQRSIEAAVVAFQKESRFPLPDKPSIVVLPFRNLSGNPQRKVYSDGLTINLIAQLSRLSGIFVISEHTAFTYREPDLSLRELAGKLGVRYVARGSMQIVGEKIRVIFSLNDASLDRSISTISYNRKLTDWFEIQDDIIRRIINSLQVTLSEGEQGIFWGRTTKNLEAMTLFWRGMDLVRQINPESNRKAMLILAKAKSLDATSTAIFSGMAYAHFLDAKYGWSPSPQKSMQQAAELAKKAISIDPNFSDSYTILGAIALATGDYAGAIKLGRRAVDLSPNSAEITAALGMIYNFAGRPKDAIKQIGQAMRLSPRHPSWYFYQMGLAHYLVGDFSRAIDNFEELLKKDPKAPASRMLLIASYVRTNRLEAAREAAGIFRKRNPSMHPGKALALSEPFQDPSIVKGIVENLKAAGLE